MTEKLLTGTLSLNTTNQLCTEASKPESIAISPSVTLGSEPDRWTDEEVAVLRQWQSDSFWYRCVPFSGAFVLATEGLISRGRLLGLARWPRWVRIPLSLTCGFILGRTTTIRDLNRRLREQCPDGVVAQFIRQREQMVRNRHQQQQQQQFDEPQSFKRQDTLPDQDRTGLPGEGYSSEVLPELNKAPSSPDSQPSGKRPSYYDRLREQNKYSSGGTELTPLPSQQPEEKEPVFFADKPQTSRQRGKKNKYGDDWED